MREERPNDHIVIVTCHRHRSAGTAAIKVMLAGNDEFTQSIDGAHGYPLIHLFILDGSLRLT